ncbi:hypothetical protein QTH97_09505 [Variovorax sp. J22R24]|uniref:hypothetical protein n=1 Tax=Variovorax gracilis TaxID=3053502 RepID=UPI002578444E|nr:hypothetical protein [Variovorax sp. J22R24]MDM0105166.1 hypothetical protein [Variovorax sp. J22R24]
MPRWLAASFIAFVLSCFGFAAVAHSSTHALDHCSASLAQVQHDLSPSSDTPLDDAEDASAAQDEVSSGCTEAAAGGFHAFIAIHASQPVPQPAMSATPSPFLAQPKRPPRDHAFIL